MIWRLLCVVASTLLVTALHIPENLGRFGTGRFGNDQNAQVPDYAQREMDDYRRRDPDASSSDDLHHDATFSHESKEERQEREEKRMLNLAIAHHSLHPPYLDAWAGNLQHWSFGDSTVITGNYIRLTPNKQSRSGYLWNNFKNELPSWEVHLSFDVRSLGGVGGDGMAFWYTQERPTNPGPILGHPQMFHGLGVLFDSYDNDGKRDNPSVMIVYNSGSTLNRLDPAMDFKSQDNEGIRSNDHPPYCMWDFRNTVAPDTAIARIRFSGDTVEVYMSHGSARDEVPCATLSGIQLPTGYYFGFTGETGGVADKHDIHYFHVTPLADPVALKDDAAEVDSHDHDRERADKTYWRKKSPEEEEEERRQRQLEEESKKEATSNSDVDAAQAELSDDATHDYRRAAMERQRFHRETPPPPPEAPDHHAQQEAEAQRRVEEEKQKAEIEHAQRVLREAEERKAAQLKEKVDAEEKQRRAEAEIAAKKKEDELRKNEVAREAARAEEEKKRVLELDAQRRVPEVTPEPTEDAAAEARKAEELAQQAAEAAREAQRKADEARKQQLVAEEREREAQRKRLDVKMRARRGNTPV